MILESRGNLKESLKLINKTLGKAENFIPGNISILSNQSNMAPIYEKTKVLFLPSLWHESGARVIAEAQLNGIPVVATKCGGNEEMVGNGGIIFDLPKRYFKAPYVEIPTKEELKPTAKIIMKLFHDEEIYNDFVKKAQLNANKLFNKKKNILKLEKHIQEIIDKKAT